MVYQQQLADWQIMDDGWLIIQLREWKTLKLCTSTMKVTVIIKYF